MAQSSKKQASLDQVITDSQQIHERPMDPTRDAEDFLGDTTGRTGVTTGDPRQISAEPDEVSEDSSFLPGGIISDPTKVNPDGFTKEQLSDEQYNKQVLDGMSVRREQLNDDLASDDTRSTVTAPPTGESINDDQEDPMGTNDVQDPEHIPVAESGEEEVSGSAPDVEADDDVGDMMKRYTGVDPDPDMDNPQELGVAEEVDEDEEIIRTT